MLRSDFNWAAALPPELPVDAAKAGKHCVTCTILDTFGRSIEVMCGRSGDHISVIYLSEPVARVSDETLEALCQARDAASMC